MKRKNQFGEDIVFIESSAAAQSLKNFWTRMASTYGCIQVMLSQNSLIIKPRRLVAWFIDLLQLDLNHTILINQIHSIEEKGNWMSYKKIQLSFINDQGEAREILLYLRKHEDFLHRMRRGLRELS